MKRIITGSLTLLVAVSAYYYVQTPPLDAVGAVPSATKPAEQLSPTTPTNSPAGSQTEMSSTSAEQSAPDENALRIAAALDKFGDLRGRALMDALEKDPLAKGIGAEILLAMVEAGYLDSNESIFASGEFGTYSPVYVAILITEGELSTEHFQRFLDLGAQVSTDDAWLDLMASSAIDKGILELWYEAATVGPELHQQLIDMSLIDGNLELVDFIVNDKGGRYDLLTFSGKQHQSIRNVLMDRKSLTDADIEALHGIGFSGKDGAHGERLFAAYEMFIRQAELLLRYSNLTSEQRREVEASREALKHDLQRLKERFAR